MSSSMKLRSRYEVKNVLSRGGMGIVYKAYDTVIKREVALKTILEFQGLDTAQLFQKEWELQASLIHPNVVEIFDVGEFEEDAAVRPYFVMPLLPGVTLAELIKSSSARLTAERSLDIICQTCRGLQAAHERGLIHRDLKPSNIFVLNDDSVKIIDFGLAHSDMAKSVATIKGTLPYMAPELLQLKPASVFTDIFGLGAVCYESLTLRRAFEGTSDGEVCQRILHHYPPPVNEVNKAIAQLVGRVVHKALAKQPSHRFSSAREFGDTLQRAMRNEPIEYFDIARVQPRIERATKAFERGEYQIAAEILSDLEGEGHVHPDFINLRDQIESAVRRVNVQTLLKSARQFLQEDKFALSLHKIQEALQLDHDNDAAIALKNQIEGKQRETQAGDWSQIADQHLENNAFSNARDAIQHALALRPSDSTALAMYAEVDRREKELDPSQAAGKDLRAPFLEKQRQNREPNVASFKPAEENAKALTNQPEARALGNRTRSLEHRDPTDPESQSISREIYARLEILLAPREEVSAARSEQSAPKTDDPQLPVSSTEADAIVHPSSPADMHIVNPEAAPKCQEEAAPAAAETSLGTFTRGRLEIGVAAVVLLLAGAAYEWHSRHKSIASSLAPIRVDVRTKPPGATIKINGKLQGMSDLQLDLAPGTYSIQAELGGYQPLTKVVQVNSSGARSLDLHLVPLSGTLLISTKVDNANVYINDQLYGDKTRNGGLRIPNLPATRYVVRVDKEGFDSGPAQVVSVNQNVDANVKFDLKAVSHTTSLLQIHKATAGARVFIDGKDVGTTDAAGEFQGPSPAGSHSVEVRKNGVPSRQIIHSFSVGRSTVVPGSTLVVEPGEHQASVRSSSMTGWDRPGSWIFDGQWYAHKGGNFIPYQVVPINGRLSFSLRLVKGKRLQWAVNHTDDKNYILFRMDKKVFERIEVHDGKTTPTMRVVHNLNSDQEYTFKIDISPDHVQHSVKRGQAWFILDNLVDAGRRFDKGPFGLIIPSRDEFAVQSFFFEPY